MGNNTGKSGEHLFQLNQEVISLKESINKANEKLQCLSTINNHTKRSDPENEILEIQYLKKVLQRLENKKHDLETWKKSKFVRKIGKILNNVTRDQVHKGFALWKKSVAGEYGSSFKEKVEIEGIFTMDSLEEIDEINDGNFERLAQKSLEPEKLNDDVNECLGVIEIYRIFEDFMIYKGIQNIKASIRKEPIKLMPEAFVEYLKQKYKKNSLSSQNKIMRSVIMNTDKHYFITLLHEFLLSPQDLPFPIPLQYLITDLFSLFDKYKKSPHLPCFSPKQSNRMEGGSITIPGLIQMLHKLLGSKKVIYSILSSLRPADCSHTEYLKYLILESLSLNNLNPEQFFSKLNYNKHSSIYCSDLIDGIKYYSYIKIDKEDHCLVFQIFGQDNDFVLSKELFLQCFDSDICDSKMFLVNKVKVVKAVVEAYKRTQQDSNALAIRLFEELNTEHLTLTQLRKVIKKLNKTYDWDYVESLFKEETQYNNAKNLLSKSAFLKIINKFSIGNKTLSSLRKEYEGYIEIKPEPMQRFSNISSFYLNESNFEDLQNSLAILIDDLE